MTSATTITLADFQGALSRYPEVLKSVVKKPKPGSVTLEELDQYRYVDGPARFSAKTGKLMEIDDVLKLLDWKLRHGTFRPSLPKLVASNSTEQVQEATKDAFAHYASSPSEIKTAIQKLAGPLKGIGPAAASLLLAVHDPDHVIFFSDEAYRWLCADGNKVALKYDANEFENLLIKAKALMGRLVVSPIDIEKVAYVLVKEGEPAIEPAEKKEPSGRPRGRPKKSDSENKTVEPVTPNRGRGRPPKADKPGGETPKAATSGKRGQPKKIVTKDTNQENEVAAETPKAVSTGKGGRPKKLRAEEETTPNSNLEEESKPVDGEKKGRGRPKKSQLSEGKDGEEHHEDATIPATHGKRKAEDDTAFDHDDKKLKV